MEMKERRKRTLARLIGDMRTKDFAEQYDLDASYLSQILNGHRGMGEKAARTMEIKIGLPEGTFLHPSVEGVSGEPSDNQGQESNVIAADFSKKGLRDGELRITQYDLRAAMGSGQLPADYLDVLREITIHRSFFESAGVSYTSASKLAVVTGWGQSMEPTINHGDPIFIDCGITDFVSDGVYLLTWDNLAYIKRVQKVSKTELKIISDNRNHDPFVVNAEDVIFHARAIMVWNGKKL